MLQAILIGRVVQRGNDITPYIELIDVQKDTLIWKGDYYRSMANLVALQSEVARDVSSRLKSRLSGADVAKVEKGYTANPEAYRLYLQGRFYWNKRNEADLKKSIEYFDQAIAIDPAYALAYAGLADVYQVMTNYAANPRPEETYPKARVAAQKALEIDPKLAGPHAALGVVLHEYEWNHAEAEKEFKQAIEIDPNYASGRQWYGEYLSNMGRFDEAIAEQKRALELDPLSPIISVTLGNAYRADHRYDDAIAQYQKALEIDPKFPNAHGNLVATYFLKGMYEQAIDDVRKRRLSLTLKANPNWDPLRAEPRFKELLRQIGLPE
jgi:tetratricopeptide (TPR) repeat protein